MVPWAVGLTVIGFASMGFGAWGIHTKAGRARFDEMAGIIPFSAYWFGIFLLAVSALLWAVYFFKK